MQIKATPNRAALTRTAIEQVRAALRAQGFRGEIETDPVSRAAMSTDNSVYQIEPDLIVAPHDQGDVQCLVAVLSRPEFATIAITARGGGTGTNAQALNSGVIVDFRRHMRRVLAVNAAEGWADVEPGVVLDELNEALAATGLFFAPNTSTANRCTIGGMVSTDASGKGSRIFGKTSDNIFGLQVVTAAGVVLDSLDPRGVSDAPLLTAVAEACDAGRAALLAKVPQLSRRFTGYDLERARPDGHSLDWWRLFIGAEGTLGLVTRIRVKLVRRAKFNRLLVIAFQSFEQALAASQALLVFEPLAIECLDEWVQRLAEEAGLLEDLPIIVRGQGDARTVYNFVEFAGDDAEALAAQVDGLRASLADVPGVVGSHLASDRAEIARLWAIRSASVGLLGRSTTRRVPIAFVEDCVVPPENLAAFVKEFGALLSSEGLAYGIYGHADVGCLHVRPALDIDDGLDRQRLETLSDAVYAMVNRHGGIFWGEHGKGVRGQYLKDFVGPTAYAAFEGIKRAFDPSNQFNPGKLVSLGATAFGVGTTPMRARRAAAEDVLAKAFACNGNALCLNYAKTAPMCPSFKVSNDLKHSPKGRAEALKAWHGARQAGAATLEAVEAAAFQALDGCLGCKACASSCPVHVDIPEMKSHFLQAYYRKHRRSAADLAGIWLEQFGRSLARLRPLLRLGHGLGLQQAMSNAIGLCDTPLASARGLRGLGYSVLRPGQVGNNQPENAVLVAVDMFTALFDTEAIADVCDGLKALGYAPLLLDLPSAGKAAHVKGDRPGFLRQARRLKHALDMAGASGLPLVGVDPAFVLMLRSEYAHAGLAPNHRVLLVQDFLLAAIDAGLPRPRIAGSMDAATMLLHCTESAAKPTAGQDWQRVFTWLGLPVTVAQTGCCGMAGLYGHERKNQAYSRQLFDMSWAPALADQAVVYASGFSCRCQAERFAAKPSAHPLRLIARALARPEQGV